MRFASYLRRYWRPIGQQMGTFAADHLKDLADVIEHIVVEDRLDELNVTEVSRAVDLGAHARLAQSVLVHRSHAIIINTVNNRVAIFTVKKLLLDVADRQASHVLLRKYTQSQAIYLVEGHI